MGTDEIQKGKTIMNQRENRFRKNSADRKSEFEERVIEISRVSRVVKGGRRIRFRIIVVIGDRNGRVGYGIAKANEISVGVKKAVSKAKKQLISVPIIAGTIPYGINLEYGSAKIMLKPAAEGTSIVAGGVIRIVCELAGIKNLLSKILGTANKINNVKALFAAFSSFDQEKVQMIKNRSSEQKNQPKSEKKILIKKSDKKSKKDKK